jgi:hypothetical protein
MGKSFARPTAAQLDRMKALVDQAMKAGRERPGNVYPYTRGNNNLASIIPPWAHEGGTAKLLERLRDPEQPTQKPESPPPGTPSRRTPADPHPGRPRPGSPMIFFHTKRPCYSDGR